MEAGQWHGVTEGTAFRRGGYRSPLPCSTHPLPVGHRSSLGPPGPPNNCWFVAGNGCSGRQAQLDQHSLLPDWPGELLHRVTRGKPTGNVNKWRFLEKKIASQLTFYCGAHLVLSALRQPKRHAHLGTKSQSWPQQKSRGLTLIFRRHYNIEISPCSAQLLPQWSGWVSTEPMELTPVPGLCLQHIRTLLSTSQPAEHAPSIWSMFHEAPQGHCKKFHRNTRETSKRHLFVTIFSCFCFWGLGFFQCALDCVFWQKLALSRSNCFLN